MSGGQRIGCGDQIRGMRDKRGLESARVSGLGTSGATSELGA